MQNSQKVNPVAKRNQQIADTLCTYMLAANTEQAMRLLWQFTNAVFRGQQAGYTVQVEKAKAKRKFQLDLALTERDAFLLPDEWKSAFEHGHKWHVCPPNCGGVDVNYIITGKELTPEDEDYEFGFSTHSTDTADQDNFEAAEMEGRL